MNQFDISSYRQFSEIPLNDYNTLKFSVYVLDKNWNYLFVSAFVEKNLGTRGTNLIGKNMWQEFRELTSDPSFILLRKNTEKGLDTNIITNSPVNSQRLNIIGRPLRDCYFFSASILPKKEDLIDELRKELRTPYSL